MSSKVRSTEVKVHNSKVQPEMGSEESENSYHSDVDEQEVDRILAERRLF